MLAYTITTLNLVWLGVSLAALAWFVLSSRGSRRNWRTTTCRALALSLALVSLFPCVSASDDVARLDLLGSQDSAGAGEQWTRAQHPGDNTPLATLVRLLEILEASQTAVAIHIGVALCLFAWAQVFSFQSIDGLLPACAGRAPPLAPSL